MKIVRSGMCSNSPKNAFVEELAIKVVATLGKSGASASDEDYPIRIYGESFDAEPDEIVVFQAISHGKAGAANGEIRLGDNVLGFAISVTFKTSKGDRAESVKVYVGTEQTSIK